MCIEHVVELEEAFSHGEILLFDLLLRIFNRPIERGVLELFALSHGFFEDTRDRACISEETHKVILKRDETFGETRVALTGATTAELTVNPPGLVTLGANHEEPAQIGNALTELNISSPASHISSDGDRTFLPGFGYDLGFLRVKLGVQNTVHDFVTFEHARE